MDDRLQKFVTLVEIGNFTRAAKELHISQPALTLAIHKLERELRTPLLIRANRKLELTPAGHLAYGAAIKNKTNRDNLFTSLIGLAGERPKVAIGMIDSIAANLCTSAQPLDGLEASADVSIIVNNSRYLRAAIENRKLDLAFVVEDPNPNPRLESRSAGIEPFVIVCLPDRLELAQAEMLAGRLPNFISYDQQSVSYWHISRKLQKLNIKPDPILYSTSPDVMLRMVLRGRGVAVLPYMLTKEFLEAGTLVALKKDEHVIVNECPISIIKLHGRILPPPLEIFAQHAEAALISDKRQP